MDSVVSAAWPVFLGSPTIPGLPNLSRATVAGIAVAISGNVLISLALNCQKLAHLRLERARELKRVHRTGSGSPKQNGRRLGPGVKGRTIQEAHEAEWENELTPTNGGRPEAGYSQGAESGSASAASETQPLLLRTAEEDTVYVSRKASPISRLTRWAKRADHAHAASVHPTMAVDVLTVRPTNGHTPSEDDKEEEEANEGAYLKSKLWYVLPKYVAAPLNHVMRIEVAWLYAHDCRRNGQFYFLCVCACIHCRATGNGTQAAAHIINLSHISRCCR